MVSFSRVDIETESPFSLCWRQDELLDILGGGTLYRLDGTMHRPRITRGYAYKFDSVISNNMRAVLYEAHGTKGLLVDLEKASDIRELNRHYYHANDYNFPVTLFTLSNGLEALAHCPNSYEDLDIDLVESGERLTKRDYKGSDIFHSNLAASADGRFLLSRGWVWHPLNIVNVYDVEKARRDPTHLDGWGIPLPDWAVTFWEPETATFCGGRLVLSGFIEGELDAETEESMKRDVEVLAAEEGVPESAPSPEGPKVRRVVSSELLITDKEGNPVDLGDSRKRPPGMRHLLLVLEAATGKVLSAREMPEFLGRLMPVGDSHVVSFYDHPKLIEASTGKVVQRWEDLNAGPEIAQPSVMMKKIGKNHVALDPANKRFAVGNEGKVAIVTIRGL